MQANILSTLSQKLVAAGPVQVLKEAFAYYPAKRVALSFSGAEDVVLIDMVARLAIKPQVFCLDTGRLHSETLQFIDKVEKVYALPVQRITPEAVAVERLVREKGLFSFYEDGHEECCGIRKVAPLRAHLGHFDAWITGQRRDQTAIRSALMPVEADTVFSTEQHRIVKFNPLTHWARDDVWRYIRDNQVPCNSLHDKGYASIGCEPCTRAIRPGEHERAGRWWWEENTARECGLHVEQG